MQEITANTGDQTNRRYDLDWLRFIAILILLFYHTGMLFNSWSWHIKNNETSDHFRYWMMWFHYWRMPLLLFISGAGTYMALGKRTPRQFVRERVKKLFIPLLFGMFVIVPPQIYYEHITEYGSYWDFYKTVFNFIPYPKGSFSWHHLWFIMYLLLYSLLALPLLLYLRSPRSEKFKVGVLRYLSSPAGLISIPFLIILFTQWLLRPSFPEETHDLIHDWAYFVYYACFFVFGMIAYSNQRLWESIGLNRKHLLTAGSFFVIILYIINFHFRGFYRLPASDHTLDIWFDVVAIMVAWSSLITVIAYGQHYLNRPHRLLPRFNEALYPFYILHQTVIIMIGYYICQLDWSISTKFWVVSLLTLVICVVLYMIFIQSNRVMRFLFGLKSKN